VKIQIDKLKAIAARLKKLTEEERAFIGKHAFDQVAALATQKESLLAEFDEAARALDTSELSEQLVAELDTIRKAAEENAAALKAMAQGVRDARARLKKIREADLNAGVYGAGGAALRNPDASTITAKA
jgi:hypothetical protein